MYEARDPPRPACSVPSSLLSLLHIILGVNSTAARQPLVQHSDNIRLLCFASDADIVKSGKVSELVDLELSSLVIDHVPTTTTSPRRQHDVT